MPWVWIDPIHTNNVFTQTATTSWTTTSTVPPWPYQAATVGTGGGGGGAFTWAGTNLGSQNNWQAQQQAADAERQRHMSALQAMRNNPAVGEIERVLAGPAIISRDRARRRSKALFLSLLNDNERAEYARSQTVRFRTPSGRIIRLRQGSIANVDRISDKGVVLERLCAHPNDPELPVFDHMIGQLLHLRDPELETEFFRVANRHPH